MNYYLRHGSDINYLETRISRKGYFEMKKANQKFLTIKEIKTKDKRIAIRKFINN